jgi:disease resistance protein RPM1
MEGTLVSAAAGALKPVLGKLATLILMTDEYKRLKGLRGEIGFLARELAAMEAFLLKKSNEEDPDVQNKVWMKEVRELSYDIEDNLDDFMTRVDDKSAKPDGFMEKIKNLLDRTKARSQIAKAIEDLKKQIVEVSKRHKRYMGGEGISKANNTTVDPRALAIFEDVSKLVGINGPKEELIRLFNEETRCESKKQRPKMISIVGFGGLGKTTLAGQVYEELKGQFDCHAFISVSRNPDMLKVLRTILSQLNEGRPSSVEDIIEKSSIEDIPTLITEISNFLGHKRYYMQSFV